MEIQLTEIQQTIIFVVGMMMMFYIGAIHSDVVEYLDKKKKEKTKKDE